MKKNTRSWIKAIAFVTLLFGANYVFASDTVSIQELNQTATDVKSSTNAFAQIGGMLAIIIGGCIIGFGKAKGELAIVLGSIAIMVGVVAFAYGTYKQRISEGFDFSPKKQIAIKFQPKADAFKCGGKSCNLI